MGWRDDADKTTITLVDFAQKWSRADLSDAAWDLTIKHLFDTIAVAIAGSGSEPAPIAAKIARMYSDRGATVFGYGMKTSPEIAALANTMMVRTYDYNDGQHLGHRGAGHPSDMISGVLAGGEIAHSSGKDVLVAIALAYEFISGIGWNLGPKWSGWDQGTFMQVAVALSVGKLWGMTDEQLANAQSLAIVPNLPMGVARQGILSMMKGCTTAFSTRNGVFAAMLCQQGFTSSLSPYAGFQGLWEVSDPFEPRLPIDPTGEKRMVQVATFKKWPAEGNVQVLMDLVPEILAFTSVDDIESIDLEVPDNLVRHLSDPPKYDPKTRETADHSIPYMLAVHLVDGTITLDSYKPERYLDPALRPVMAKIKVRAGDDMTHWRRNHNVPHDAVFPGPTPNRVRVRTKDGREFFKEVLEHKGHPNNPLSREELDWKFDAICDGTPSLSKEQRQKIRETWWNIEDCKDIGDAMQTVTGFRSL